MSEVDIFCKMFEVTLVRDKVLSQFCMSKHLVQDEVTKRFEYSQLNFNEWLEFVVRVMHTEMVELINFGKYKPTFHPG